MNATEINDTKAWINNTLAYIDNGSRAAVAGGQPPVAPQKPVIAQEPPVEPANGAAKFFSQFSKFAAPRLAAAQSFVGNATSQLTAVITGADAALAEQQRHYDNVLKGVMAAIADVRVAETAPGSAPGVSPFAAAVAKANESVAILGDAAKAKYLNKTAADATEAAQKAETALEARKQAAGW